MSSSDAMKIMVELDVEIHQSNSTNEWQYNLECRARYHGDAGRYARYGNHK